MTDIYENEHAKMADKYAKACLDDVNGPLNSAVIDIESLSRAEL